MEAETARLLLDALLRVARQSRAIFLRIEPAALDNSGCRRLLEQLRFRSSLHTNQPRATLIVDLAPGLDVVLARMHQKTRYNIRYALKQGVEVRVGRPGDLESIYRLIKITGRRAGFGTRTMDYYRHEWETFAGTGQIGVFIAFYEGIPLAVNVSAAFGGHAAYLHGASSGEHINLQPNYLVMWEAMRWAQAKGCRTYDLWGIPDEAGQTEPQGQSLPAPSSTGGLWGWGAWTGSNGGWGGPRACTQARTTTCFGRCCMRY
jgi:lipid II:glycine glycyltransferase (peptidoglycan interpeptide bridge formation enzyme)